MSSAEAHHHAKGGEQENDVRNEVHLKYIINLENSPIIDWETLRNEKAAKMLICGGTALKINGSFQVLFKWINIDESILKSPFDAQTFPGDWCITVVHRSQSGNSIK